MSRKPNHYLISVSIFLIIAGVRLWMIAAYGGPLPLHDQWDAEAAFLFKPWLEGNLRWAELFSMHNEHRIVLSRLLALGLLRLNGQWDAQLEMAANAVVCGCIAVAVLVAALRVFDAARPVFVFAAVSLWLALPYAQENTLWGFQSCFYFLLLFSLIAIWGLGCHRAFSPPWWSGAIGAILACLSMASGLFAAAAVLGIAGLRALRQHRWIREDAVTVAVAAAIVVTAFYFHKAFAPHEPLKAASPLAWMNVFARCLAWPFCQSFVASSIMYLPLGWLAWFYIRSEPTGDNPKRSRQIELLLGVGMWVILQAAAIAYTRGGDGGGEISSRYMDILALGALANLGAIVIAIRCVPRTTRWRKTLLVAASLWIAGLVVGAERTSRSQLAGVAGRKAYLHAREQSVRAYLATSDRKYLEGDPPGLIPYPRGSRLATLLDDPTIRSILPAAVRLPLRVEAKTSQGAAFVPNGYPPGVLNPPYERAWGSYSALGGGSGGSMESTIIRPRLPYLQIELAGYLREGMSLTGRSAVDNKEANFIPATRIDDWWKSGYLPVNGQAVTIIARDENPQDWFAFREPREVGRYSYYANQLIAKGRVIFILGLVLFSAVAFQRGLIEIDRAKKMDV